MNLAARVHPCDSKLIMYIHEQMIYIHAMIGISTPLVAPPFGEIVIATTINKNTDSREIPRSLPPMKLMIALVYRESCRMLTTTNVLEIDYPDSYVTFAFIYISSISAKRPSIFEFAAIFFSKSRMRGTI